MAGVGQIQVDHNLIPGLVAKLNTDHEAMTHAAAQILAQIEMYPGWLGSGRDGFNNLMEKFHSDVMQECNLMEEKIMNMDVHHKTTEATELEQKAIWNRNVS